MKVAFCYSTTFKGDDIKTISDALRDAGATTIRINSGPVINDKLRNTLQKLFDLGKNYQGFKVIKTGDADNMFILEKKL